MSKSSNQNKRRRKEVETVAFEIIKADHREELEDDSALSSGTYSRFHLAANEGDIMTRTTAQTQFRLTQIEYSSDTHHNKGIFIDPRSYFQIDGVYEVQPHNPRETEIYRLNYETGTSRRASPAKVFENCEPHAHTWHSKGMYSKGEALCYLISVPKGRQLRRLILFMTQNKLVPVQASSLYALVAKYRKDEEVRRKQVLHNQVLYNSKYAIKGNNWSCDSGNVLVILPNFAEDNIEYVFEKKVRMPALPGSSSSEVKIVKKTSRTLPKNRHKMRCLKATDTPKTRLIGKRCWKGQLFLPVLFYWDGDVPGSSADLDKEVYFSNIVEDFGDCRARDHNGDDRMYFTRFDPPENIEDISSSQSFIKLREFIKKSSSDQCGLVISSNGGSKRDDRHVWFGCRSCIFDYPSSLRLKEKKAKKTSNYCPFGFQLRWDDKGYYIHLKNSSCPWHTCWKVD
ncbi:hypothetical protein THAOC_02401 [Thalassiosira oceanica]|uniref:Uncharacterized protein n=2 Tax=Thalassiosira oceanica TaxID=159749 RepID=K0TQD6_THAOC|nr:hypothetical protein THAOC_02401 [Thalassiosira oceanica]|mmetsp:Transcript_21989/g.51921  ORF Transcript_21989/g.51921 Transcript_21989/m.51921 type:complete len:455 (-) Transcript_21989:31-1395(-)|eukprot:EJK75862.1 hypothetical protein THAOC_02401 [Thalassiosira oceanica]